MITKYHTH